MYLPRLIPILLLKNEGLVKTVNFRKPVYIGDALNAVQIFNKLKTDELVFLDIDATKEKRTISVEMVERIGGEAFMPFAVGGGIRTLEQAEKLINAGAEKVVLNTIAHTNGNVISEIAEVFGRQSVVVAVDVKKNLFGKWKVFVNSGTVNTNRDPLEYILAMETYGAGEIMLTSIDKEGTKNGLNLDLLRTLKDKIRIPIIAHGGMNSLEHFKEGIDAGASAVAGGSFFVYSGRQGGVLINYPSRKEILEIFQK